MKKDLIPALITFIGVGVVCYGLAAARPVASPLQPTGAAGAGGDGGQVVMHVNGEPVTEREFNAFLLQAPQQAQFYYATPEGRRILADELVKLKALEQEARRLGVDKDPEVATRLEMNRTNILAGSALRKIIGAPSEDRLRAEYEKERQRLESTELSHILIAYRGGAVPPRSGTPPTEAAAMQEAQRLVARIRGGADFAQVARATSADLESAANGGLLGALPPGSMPPQLEQVTSALQPGQVSDPVKSEFGIHIFKAGARRSQPYEQVREALAAKVQREEAEAAMERLEKSAKVELDPKFFPEPKTQPGA